MARKASIPSVPHSWSINDWPPNVYPGRSSKGRYVVRANKSELLKVGALTRIGRDLVVMGAGYSAWLATQRARVDGFTIAPNVKPQAEAG